jgi:PAS domain S-box-containing protein
MSGDYTNKTLFRKTRNGWPIGPIIYAAVILPVLAVGVFSYVKTKKDLTELAFAQKRSTAHLTSITVKEKFDRLRDIGVALATRVQFRRLVAEKKWGEAIRILEHVPRDFPFVERVFLVDSAGTLWADTPELVGVRGRDFSHRDWYRGVLAGGQVYVSDVYTRAAEPRMNVVAVATPIKGTDERLKGILVLQIALGTLFEWSRSIDAGPSGFVYLVDRKGRVATHPKHLSRDSIADFSGVPVVRKLMEGRHGVEVLYNPVEQEERLSAYEPVPDYGWGVVALQPTAKAFASREASLRSVLAVYGFVSLLGFVLAFLIQRALADRQRSEQVIRASEERYRLLFDENPLPAWVFDLDTLGFLAVNAAAIRHYGYSMEEFLKMTITDIRPAEDVAALLERVSMLKSGAAHPPGEWRHRKKDGAIIHVEIVSHLLSFGGKPAELVLANDITERKRTEEERDKFFTLSLEMLCIADFDGYFKRLNPIWEKTLGFTVEEMCSKPFIEFVHPDDREATRREAEKLSAGINVISFENRYRCKDGSYRWLQWNSTMSFENRLIYAAARDITERKQWEEEIEKLNESLRQQAAQLEAANRELEAFSYSVSHDLRAPLRSIDGFSQALLEDCGERLDDSGKDYLGRVRGACLRMAQLIDDLLNLSRVSRGAMRVETVDLSEMAREVVSELQKQSPERKTAFVIADNLKGNGDARLLRVALENLLGNAWKYTSKHPSARIEFGARREPDGKTVFFVRDDGAGFDMAYAGKLFGAFQRLHTPSEFAGTGVGLATVQRIIHRHGGRVWAEGSVEQGATFYFTL